MKEHNGVKEKKKKKNTVNSKKKNLIKNKWEKNNVWMTTRKKKKGINFIMQGMSLVKVLKWLPKHFKSHFHFSYFLVLFLSFFFMILELSEQLQFGPEAWVSGDYWRRLSTLLYESRLFWKILMRMHHDK